jgi:hypothetical protein
MIQIFNSTLEVSTRLLLQLYVHAQEPLEKETLLSLDFLTIYGRHYQILQDNLNGDSPSIKAEIQQKRADIKKLYLSELVKNGFAKVVNLPTGYGYQITSSGVLFCQSLSSDYMHDYLSNAQIVSEKVRNLSTSDIQKIAFELGDNL